MKFLDLSLPDPAENLALDEALLLAAEDGTAGEVLRLWESPNYAVIVGAGGSVTIDVNVPACVGVPDTTPAALRVRPGGSDPRNSDQVSGGTPPVSVSCPL